MAQIIIPQINPVKYVPFELDAVADSIKLHDRYNFDHLPASFEGKTPYNQKWVKGDPIRQQIWSSGVAILFIQLVNCNGAVVATIYPSAASLSGYLVNNVAWNIHQFDYDTTALAPGEYYLIFNYGQNINQLDKLISERQEIVTELEESVLFKYSHSYNEYNTIFKTSYNSYFNQTFFFRVEGRAHQHKPEGIFTEFDDQKLNKTLLSAKPFDSWQFTIGSGKPVPEWVGTVLNFIRSCDTVFVDDYKISFFDKWEPSFSKNYRKGLYTIRFAKSQTEYARVIDVCDPVAAAPLALPDAYVNAPYIYTHQLTGTKPYTLGNVTAPAWMQVSILDDLLYIQTFGTFRPNATADDVPVSITVTNACGTLELTDTIDVLAEIVCIAPQFTGNDVYPQAVFNQPWNAFIELNGTAPFSVDSVIKPAWLTITPVSNGIQLTGTPNLSGSFTVAFNILNCAGVPGVITYYQNFNVSSNVTLIGYNNSFSNTLPAQSGQILAAPGTLVTVTINANGGGPIPPNTYTLTITLTGATPSQPLTVTNGQVIATFVMPASGFVGWVGAYNGSNNLGNGTMSVS